MRRLSALTTTVLLLVLAQPSYAVAWNGYQVGRILPPDSKDCVAFQLTGVNEADPAVPGIAWFAVPRSAFGFKEIYALLLTAKASGIPITVETTGQLAGSQCHPFVGVWQIYTTS
jgi:hypothetical protein